MFDKHNRGYISASDLRAVLQCLGEDLSEEESELWSFYMRQVLCKPFTAEPWSWSVSVIGFPFQKNVSRNDDGISVTYVVPEEITRKLFGKLKGLFWNKILDFFINNHFWKSSPSKKRYRYNLLCRSVYGIALLYLQGTNFWNFKAYF